jgi:hypothetical protein
VPTIKNVVGHPDDLHDGRPIASFATAEISTEELALDHYQTRLDDGSFVVAEDAKQPPAQASLPPALSTSSAPSSSSSDQEVKS